MLEQYFNQFRQHIIGHDLNVDFNNTKRDVVYADWTASGRLYQPIETFLVEQLGPYVANTHTETNLTGSTMTRAYHDAQQIIKRHVNASANDALISAGSGMTTVVNKLQRMLGLRVPERFKTLAAESNLRPVVFITHMEHHSNQTTWNACEVDVVILAKGADGKPCIQDLKQQLEIYKQRTLKIGSFTACSNVTGIKTDYHLMAKIMHQHGGLCFVDFACSAPYVDIDMHPSDPEQKLDAIFFSPHKFLGGPGSSGILVFDKALYGNKIPDQPGGGTVTWTNPWGQQGFYDDVEVREDGGTPGFLQTIKVALAIKLKDQMGTDKIHQREQQLTNILLNGLANIDGVGLLEGDIKDRLCIVSFYVKDMHYNLMVRLLNDRFGIQSRGGCSCAGTYGHILLNVDKSTSGNITGQIDQGDLSAKPGWIRVSLHPTSTDAEARFIVQAVNEIVKNAQQWQQDYRFDPLTADYIPIVESTSSIINIADFDPMPKQQPDNWLSRFLQRT
ncbi:aminotransferase class V-fold PLP-dependent enzyme [Psychrosphaera sp. B3R10]|uniref:aminotransferase class V-fold PLP-dependent enzyme n=1 Tax=unclassified Psychrosphaera TaxID=2641570 RepID=UPI001C0825B6|nr:MULTISPECIES: aminotransferase class V-fold PLP-dependent enzyme [unclassified Psychrosphaera]MBU2881558.1 aminotransferase class V-fold PLP-dependent enzyme [Psychrosphaera sp. I2R16]MBU2991187.1 aminotransferase class V-fold PLP-dependent enzyme [Psychrosphaera sp. B3R10]MDO6719482.1 aminotransferase class V-fold PLP-dependent enzyme [Psychrosphaera sp. 1_MG-2023]